MTDALIASSAKAFETAIEIERFAHLPVHAVGAKTALSARNKGFEPGNCCRQCGSDFTSLIAKIS